MPWIVLLIVILVILLALCLASLVIAGIIVGGRRQTLEESWQWQLDHAPGCRVFRREDLTDYEIKSAGGYVLHASFLPAASPSDRYLVLAHGYTDTRYGSMKYVQFYHRLGFSCVIYDERGHGENPKTACTYGVREAKDLLAVIEDTYRRYGENIRLGIHGESLGGATVLTSLKYQPRVCFAVDDCGFADILPILKAGLKFAHLPSFLVYPASLMAKLRYEVAFTEAKPLEGVRGNQIPLLIMHGAKDDFILPDHSRQVKETTEGYAELHFFPEAGHAQSALSDPELYYELLKAFLTKIRFLPEEG